MIGDGLAAVAIAVMIAMTTALLVRPVLRRLPEPVPGTASRSTATSAAPVSCSSAVSLAGIAAAVSWLSLPRYAQPMWSVLAILGVLLAAIDARTSWLPSAADPDCLAGNGGGLTAGGLVRRRCLARGSEPLPERRSPAGSICSYG